uniref:Uncharacterized protein n=1 Tax=Steinernema glaseri TaxID=37863 RepID=A0A1I7ZLY2_9BILA
MSGPYLGPWPEALERRAKRPYGNNAIHINSSTCSVIAVLAANIVSTAKHEVSPLKYKTKLLLMDAVLWLERMIRDIVGHNSLLEEIPSWAQHEQMVKAK